MTKQNPGAYGSNFHSQDISFYYKNAGPVAVSVKKLQQVITKFIRCTMSITIYIVEKQNSKIV